MVRAQTRIQFRFSVTVRAKVSITFMFRAWTYS